MTTNDWKNLLVGAGSILDIDPAPLPPMTDVLACLRAKREERAKRLRASLAASSGLPAPTADELAGRVAERTATEVAELIAGHPLRDQIRQRIGTLRFIVYRVAPRAGEPAGGRTPA